MGTRAHLLEDTSQWGPGEDADCSKLSYLTGLAWGPEGSPSVDYVAFVKPGKANAVARILQEAVREATGANVTFSSRGEGSGEIYVGQKNYREATINLPAEQVQDIYRKVRTEMETVQTGSHRPAVKFANTAENRTFD
jgi:uncharacterized protein (UPF0254 family)